MALENISTPRLMEVGAGLRGQVELPTGHRFMAHCNQAIRPTFSEPLPLAEQSSECSGSAIERARAEQSNSLHKLAEKQRKLEMFQQKVNARLRAVKRATQHEQHIHTQVLQQTDHTLINAADPKRKSALMNLANISIVEQKAQQDTLTNTQAELARCTRYARYRLAGQTEESTALSGVVILPQAEDSSSEEEVEEKENVPKARPGIRIESLVKGTEEAVRKHRIAESRKAYSLYERERMREAKKAKEHKERVERLRRETELLRVEKEQEVNEAIEQYIEPAPSLQQERVHKATKRNKSLTTDTHKVIARLRQRVSSMATPPPPMCPCDAELLNTGPGLCAQNCVFYSNARSFAQAFSSLMTCY